MSDVVTNNHKLEEEFKEDLKMPYVITICSGKGGVGKSFYAANLAYALSKQSLSVLVWDANLHYPNQHILFGVEPPVRLKEVYSGRIPVESAIYKIEENLFILADILASGRSQGLQASEILDTFVNIILSTRFDVIIIDTPAADTEDVLQCCNIADLVNIVITDEPTTLLDAYALMKIILQFTPDEKISFMVNNVIDNEDADEIASKLNLAAKKFLNMKINVLGFIPYDRAVRQSIINQELYMMANGESETAIAIKNIAGNIRDKIQVAELR
jgi:flagellar biosynthesis protein FlhG